MKAAVEHERAYAKVMAGQNYAAVVGDTVYVHGGIRPGYADGIPDEADPHAEAARKAPSWRRIAKMLLKNDRLCKALGFGQTKSDSYEKYQRIMRKRSETWKLYLT